MCAEAIKSETRYVLSARYLDARINFGYEESFVL